MKQENKEKKAWNAGVRFALEMHNDTVLHATARIIHKALEKGFSDEEIANFLDTSVEDIQEIRNRSCEMLGTNGWNN